MKKVHIIFIIFFSILIFSCGKDSKDKTAFEAAEKVFNDGRIAEAKELYIQFTKDFPTSKWRQLAETQLTKCHQILELQKEAIKYEDSKAFREAVDIYIKIFSINPKAVDTAITFSMLRSKESDYKEELATQQEEHKKELIRQESIFLKNLSIYLIDLTCMLEYHFITVAMCDESEYNEVLVTIVNESMKKQFVKEEHQKIYDSYLKIKNPPDKYKKAINEIEESYAAFNELKNTLSHLENYSRFTLRNQLAKLRNRMFLLRHKLESYLPGKLFQETRDSIKFELRGLPVEDL